MSPTTIDLGKIKTHAQADEVLAELAKNGAEVPDVTELKVAEKVAVISNILDNSPKAPAEPEQPLAVTPEVNEQQEPVVNHQHTTEPGEEDEDTDGFPFKFYRGEPVIEIRNVMLNGRLYVDIFTPGASYRITTDEFEQLKKNNG